MKVKCAYCGKEINAFELATVTIAGKKRYCHSRCWQEHQNKYGDTLEQELKRISGL